MRSLGQPTWALYVLVRGRHDFLPVRGTTVPIIKEEYNRRQPANSTAHGCGGSGGFPYSGVLQASCGVAYIVTPSLREEPHTLPRICRMPSSRVVKAMTGSQTLFQREFLGKEACHYACDAEIGHFARKQYSDAMEICSLSLTPATDPIHPFGMRQVVLEYERAAGMVVAS